MTAFIVSALLVISSTHPQVKRLEAAIHDLQPNVDDLVASQLARSLFYWSTVYHVDPFVSVAIGFQESSLIPGRVGPTGDLGVFQIHGRTIKNYHLSTARLKTDIDYMVMAHMVIMADKMRECHDINAYSCYHSFTPVHRRQYEHDVSRFLTHHKRTH